MDTVYFKAFVTGTIRTIIQTARILQPPWSHLGTLFTYENGLQNVKLLNGYAAVFAFFCTLRRSYLIKKKKTMRKAVC